MSHRVWALFGKPLLFALITAGIIFGLSALYLWVTKHALTWGTLVQTASPGLLLAVVLYLLLPRIYFRFRRRQ